MDHSFSGSALCAIDADGFVSLPAFVTNVLARLSDANSIIVAPHQDDPCMVGYDRGHERSLLAEEERLRLSPDGAAGHHSRMRRIFGRAEEGTYDPEGRIRLAAPMLRKAGVERLALFVGAGTSFEIWDPQVALESHDEALSEIAAWRCQDVIAPAPQEV